MFTELIVRVTTEGLVDASLCEERSESTEVVGRAEDTLLWLLLLLLDAVGCAAPLLRQRRSVAVVVLLPLSLLLLCSPCVERFCFAPAGSVPCVDASPPLSDKGAALLDSVDEAESEALAVLVAWEEGEDEEEAAASDEEAELCLWLCFLGREEEAPVVGAAELVAFDDWWCF